MVYCCAVNCSNNSKGKGKEKNISFFRLPRDESLKKVWLAKIKRSNLPDENNVRLCSNHFEENCYERDLKVRNTCNTLLLFSLRPWLDNGVFSTTMV